MLRKLWDHLVKIVNYPVLPVIWCKSVVIVSLSIVLGAAALVGIVDPHYRYRLPEFYDTVYYEVYATAPRLLRDLDYNTLYLGSSMTRNIFLNDIDEVLKVRSIKLAASGAATADLAKFVDIAVKAKGKKLQQIIFSLDIYSMNKPEPHYKEFEYLYRDDLKEEYRYLFSRQTYSSMYYLLKRKYRPRKKRQHQADPNRMFSTEYAGMRFGWQEVVGDAVGNEKAHHTQTPADPEVFENTLNNILLPMVKNNPQIKFVFYLAPYHIYTYCQSEQFHEADALLKQRLRVMKELLLCSNVRLYDYQADRSLVCDHDLYSDVQHFRSTAGRMIVEKLAANHRRISSAEAADANDRELRKLIAEQMPVYYSDLEKFKNKKR